MLNTIGWIGNVAFLLGAIFLAKKWISGWHMQILGNLCYIIFAVLLGFQEGFSLFILSLILIATNIFGLIQWKKIKWIVLKKGKRK